MIKTDVIRAQISVTGKLKIIALVISMLDTLYGGDREHAMKTIMAHYSYTIHRVTL